jgi:flagellar M-ring protein FliF
VQIAIPKDTVFTQKKVPPSASAVLNLREGTALSPKQIDGIKNFIASAIPKLKPENIKLINQNGSLLEQSAEDIESLKYIQQEKYKSKLEKDFAKKISDLLRPFLGSQRFATTVSINLDFTKQEISQEIFEPEGTIRSQQTTESASAGESQKKDAGGVPGAQSNIEDPNGANGSTNSKTSKEEAKNITNYEISKKVISQRDSSYASISKITAAVTFDSSVLEKLENKEEFFQNLNSIVREAIGFQEKRGDSVTVKAFKFIGLKPIGEDSATGEGEDAGGMGLIEAKSFLHEFGEYIQYLIASILLFVFYQKFIANTQPLDPAAEEAEGKKEGEDGSTYDEALGEFNEHSERTRLKNKIKSQIVNNLDGLDMEEAAKYEILIEEIDNVVTNSPEDIAKMIEMLLMGEGELGPVNAS